MKHSRYRFPLSIQTVLPDNYRGDDQFQQNMHTLQELGFSSVELNMAHPKRIDLSDVLDFLKEFDLKFSMFASGLTAKTYGLSLSSEDRGIRQRAVDTCLEIIDFVAGTDAGIILGFFKGGPVPAIADARARFRESIGALLPRATAQKVRLIVEATNRYESAIANSLDETVALIEDFQNPLVRILPDTFHMNIEEADGYAALRRYSDYYDSFHISDNNRYFPGFGAIDFQKVFKLLEELGYTGPVAIEGNIKTSFIDDVTASVEYLKPLLTSE
ncbi:hypothetical protein CSB45_02490 [candidate division KSB3 bacterium]|uniref:Xylose isomerase-like TIM barrel domain-containing protein n=1 Tax=candidate division KSB3 bacterium TaxID=2044937 RepID=A0A2G6EAA0_9BACT|nr:MAG: hypothetical protein CSB45_02490 [candidate division KSB3 bacterium]PIE30948.1 MAG: hypothetical protein CSA57_01105 [candidate division KSB3 bacterium]